ncbi:unnamed protein product [Pleuronectes platessa]|uniref:Uncharacterized protein n=1 Tax=Pleuronectes platessa TaxID=8262 RepID=A0A9N7YZF1_PLEPL|nr:unnamed protein product [Pleuronectes platessa]
MQTSQVGVAVSRREMTRARTKTCAAFRVRGLGEQSLRRPPLRGQRPSVRHREVLIRWHLTASLVRGLSFSGAAGRCPSPARKAGDRVRRSAAATLDACRALLADHLSYGDRWGNPPAGA